MHTRHTQDVMHQRLEKCTRHYRYSVDLLVVFCPQSVTSTHQSHVYVFLLQCKLLSMVSYRILNIWPIIQQIVTVRVRNRF
jgi:hypothetical protein